MLMFLKQIFIDDFVVFNQNYVDISRPSDVDFVGGDMGSKLPAVFVQKHIFNVLKAVQNICFRVPPQD